MAFESGVGPRDWRFTGIVSLYKGKGERGLNVKIIGVLAC